MFNFLIFFFKKKYLFNSTFLLQAILALEKFPTTSTQQALMDLINQNECFYKVRLEACCCLAKVREHTWEPDKTRNAAYGLTYWVDIVHAVWCTKFHLVWKVWSHMRWLFRECSPPARDNFVFQLSRDLWIHTKIKWITEVKNTSLVVIWRRGKCLVGNFCILWLIMISSIYWYIACSFHFSMHK